MIEFVIRGTAIVAVVCYAVRIGLLAARRSEERWMRRARWIWTVGGAILFAHGLCAVHFQHHWSHAAAWEHTRLRTRELTGWDSGAGLWANYATTAIWLIDLIGWQIWRDWPSRQRAWFWLVQIVLAFMMVNATAVFGPRYWTPLVAGYITLLLVVAGVGSLKRR